MIQFNLLPDVKLEYVKSQRTKRLVSIISAIVAASTLFIMILLIVVVDVFQSRQIQNLNNQISTDTTQLQNTSNLGQILTVQNQINALPSLHNQEPVASRLFAYVSEVTPAQATISRLTVNFTDNSITITGGADSLATVNKFVDTLKFSNYTSSATSSTGKSAFTNVVLTSFGYTTAQGATYEITSIFDPAIFNSTASNVSLVVPNLITTRSEIDQPKVLFQPSAAPTNKTP